MTRFSTLVSILVVTSGLRAQTVNPMVTFTRTDIAAIGQYLESADLDHDGDIDLVSASGNSVYILINDGQGNFSAGQTLTTSASGSITSISIQNLSGVYFNSAEDKDIAVSVGNASSGTVSVFAGNGDGTFGSATDYTVGKNPKRVSITYALDLDNPLVSDMVTANSSDSTISILKNNGDGTFGTKTDIVMSGNVVDVDLHNVDGDSDVDIVAAISNTRVGVLKNNGNGTFAAAVEYSVNVVNVHFRDVDLDGDQDIVTHSLGGVVSVLKNNGSGTFAAAVQYPSYGVYNWQSHVSDLNADGYPEVVVGVDQSFTATPNSIAILKNKGDGTFAPATVFSAGARPEGIATGDLNGDGLWDIAVNNWNSNTISLYIQRSTFSVPSDSVSFGFAAIGQPKVDSITVTNLGSDTLAISSVIWSSTASLVSPGSQFIPPFGSQVFTLTITPSTNGPWIDTLRFTDDATGSPHSVIVTGTSVDPSSPVATTDSTTNITESSAILRGTVVANFDSTIVNFVYGVSSGTYTDTVAASQSPFSGGQSTSVSAAIAGLASAQTYYVKVIASNSFGSDSGIERSFTTWDLGTDEWVNALRFDSDDGSYAKAGGVVTTQTDNVTIEAWVKWDGTTGLVQMIATNGYAGTVGYGLFIFEDNKLAVLVSGIAWHQSTVGLTPNVWSHVAVVRNGGTWALYKDGTTVDIGSPTTAPNVPSANFFVGGDSVGYRFNGHIDEVRVSTSARYTSNFTPQGYPFTTDGNTAALYHFNEGTGSTSSDASGNSRTLTLVNSPAWQANDNPLPVQMTALSAERQAESVVLRWNTVTEVDNSGWEIERRPVGSQSTVYSSQTEANGWTKIGFVDGAGTSTSPRSYSYSNAIPQSTFPNPHSRYAYRLKQLDRSGAFSYSGEVEVEVGGVPKVFRLQQNYPNPFNPTTTIAFTLPEDGRAVLKVFNMLGQEVATLANEELRAGVVQQKTFVADHLSTGVYYARLQFGGRKLLKRLMLLK